MLVFILSGNCIQLIIFIITTCTYNNAQLSSSAHNNALPPPPPSTPPSAPSTTFQGYSKNVCKRIIRVAVAIVIFDFTNFNGNIGLTIKCFTLYHIIVRTVFHISYMVRTTFRNVVHSITMRMRTTVMMMMMMIMTGSRRKIPTAITTITITMTMTSLWSFEEIARQRQEDDDEGEHEDENEDEHEEKKMQLQQGICIIRLISLKRFSQIPIEQQQQTEQQPEQEQNKNEHENENENRQEELELAWHHRKIEFHQKFEKSIKKCERNERNQRNQRKERKERIVRIARIESEENKEKITINVEIVVEKLNKPKDKNIEVGNDVAIVEQQQQQQYKQPKSYVLAWLLIPMRLQKYIPAIRMQFYKFSFHTMTIVARKQHTTRILDKKAPTSSPLPLPSSSATASAEEAIATTMNAVSTPVTYKIVCSTQSATTSTASASATTINGPVTRKITMKMQRKLSTDFKVEGISSEGANNGISVSGSAGVDVEVGVIEYKSKGTSNSNNVDTDNNNNNDDNKNGDVCDSAGCISGCKLAVLHHDYDDDKDEDEEDNYGCRDNDVVDNVDCDADNDDSIVGNGKKCGNPVQLSSQISISSLYMESRELWFSNSTANTINNRTNTTNATTTTTTTTASHRSHRRRNSSRNYSKNCSKHFSYSISQRLYGHNSSWSWLSCLSLASLQRSLIMLILLSALWQECECFHGSVKLSSNTVKTKYGLLRGIVVRSTPSMVEAYLGIPYASPPVGSLRFMPPITPSTWKNIRNADRFSPVCPQTVPIPPNGPEALLEVPRARLAQLRRLLPLLKNQSEDCLYLNIYVPYESRRHRRFAEHNETTPKLSTILFIHGESYEWNSGNPYDGSELAAHGNVIVVTINFRLGIFGFLKTGGKESAQGNFGLMDLVAGLHWLKENLPAFGGDAQSITILGHGTGAALANILIVSPVASDLIQRTVLISGSALSPWAIQKNPLLVKRRVAEQTGCHGDMLYYDIAPCLRTKSVAELLAVTVEHPRFLVSFAPFIDGTVISPNINSIGALTLPLGSAIVSTSGIEFANFPKRNLIFCLTSIESYLDLSAQDLEFGFNETRRDRILRTFVRNNYHYHLNEIFAVLKNEYTDWEKAIRNPLSSRDATLAFLSDGHTASSLIKLGYMHSLRGGSSYFVHFKHKTMEEEYPQRTGSVRGEDVPFWFGLPVSPLFPYNYTAQEKQISRLMLRYLANFAKTGNPNQSTKTSQTPSLSTSTIASNVAQPQPQSISKNSGISPDSQQSANQLNHLKVKRASAKQNSVNRFLNITASQQGYNNLEYTTSTRQALDLAIIYNQRRSNAMRDKRTNHRRRLRSNDDPNQGNIQNINIDSDLPFWDAYDVVNQLYLELGTKVDVLSHYRGHKLSMWLNLIPQLHKHININDQSMRHHQFPDDIHNHNIYEGVVRPQLQTKPTDDEEVIVIQAPKPTIGYGSNKTKTSNGIIVTTPTTTTECGVDGALLTTTDQTNVSPNDNRTGSDTQKDLATASTGLMGNLEVLRRLSGKQFQSYTTALVATVAVGCFLLILNILIFAGIYHQREKRARDARTKEELQESDNSKNSSLMKLNTVGLAVPGDVGKTTMIFGEYNCYDEKTKQLQASIDEKLLVELPPPPPTVQASLHDTNWACSTSTLDLLKVKHQRTDIPTSIATNTNLHANQSNEIRLHPLANMEMSSFHPISVSTGAATSSSSRIEVQLTQQQQHSRRGSFAGAINSSSLNSNQFDYAVQSSDQMSFKDIENAVKSSTDDITRDLDDDIPEPPPPPRSFQQQQQQQQQQQHQQKQQQQQQLQSSQQPPQSGGGILRQSGGSSVASTSGGKKRVHIQEISV